MPLDISNQDLRVVATRAVAAVREVTTTADANTETSLSGEDVERLQELERGVRGGSADLIARIQELEKVDRSVAETVESLTADQSKLERLEPTESEFVETQDRIEQNEERLRSLREQRDAHIAAIASIRGNLRSQITRIRDTIDKVLHIDRSLGEQLRTIFIEQGVTIASLVAAVSAILAAVITALKKAGGAVRRPEATGPTHLQNQVNRQALDNMSKTC
jgi:chromosome segregation ATPase